MKFKCGPVVYQTIIHWGFALPDGKKIIDHIYDLKIGDKIKKKNFTKWLKDNKSKLNNDSFADFDITALHDFLPILCYDKIAQTGSIEYEKQTKDSNSVESLLKKIKTFRNEVSHEYAEAVKDSHLDKMKETMRECIRAAGKLYSKDQTEIDEKRKVLDDKLNEFLLSTTHFYENRVNYISKFIETEFPANLLERYSPHFSVPLPGNWTNKDTSEIFQCSNISVITEDKKNKTTDNITNKTVFSCTKILNNKHNKFVVINGGPGSGKTTLMRNMCQDILQTSVHGTVPRYDKIEQFKIPIYLECRSEQQTNLAKFLRECLKDFLSPEDDIYEAFKIVKGLLFLIDGYDEINNNSRQLVDSVISFCRDYNASCIISSRVNAGNDLVNDLTEWNLNWTKMFIEPISGMGDKVNFLTSYAVKIDDSIDTGKLVESFKNLTAAAKEVFSSPILLALFISFFMHEPNSVSQLKNEQSAYEAVRTNFLREMARKLRNAPDSKRIAEEVVNLLGFFCLELFREEKYYLEGKDYSKLVAECKKLKGMPEDVDISSLLSCILTPEHSFKFTLYSSYQFMHSTIQESLAAYYVSEKIRELQDDQSSQGQSENRQLPKLLQALGLNESQSDNQSGIIRLRYRYIVKLLMLETLANGELSKYSNAFTLLLKKHFGPVGNFTPYPNYHLDIILSSDSNADIISIVSDSMTGWWRYYFEHKRYIKPMIEVMQTMKSRVKIVFDTDEVTNSHLIIKLLKVLEEDSEIELNFNHSFDNYQPLEEEFYTQLRNAHIKCKVTIFKACITSGEHLSILVRVLRGGNQWEISTPSVSDISFPALEEHKGYFNLRVKYTNDCPSTGSNPVRGDTNLCIEHIPVTGKENLYKIIKYICPKSKEFMGISFDKCHLTHTDSNELLKQIQGEKIRTKWGKITEIKNRWVNEDKSENFQLFFGEGEPEKREEKVSEEEEIKEKKSEEEEWEGEDGKWETEEEEIEEEEGRRNK